MSNNNSNKSNKIQIIAIIVGAIVTIATTLMLIFQDDIRKITYDILYGIEASTPVVPSNNPLVYEPQYDDSDGNAVTTNDKHSNSTTNYNNQNTNSNHKDNNSHVDTSNNNSSNDTSNDTSNDDSFTDTSNDDSYTDGSNNSPIEETPQDTIVKPKVFLGDEVHSIEFLQLDTDNIFVAKNSAVDVEYFYDGFEKYYKEKAFEENSFVYFSKIGYGMCCTLPLKQNGELYYNGIICDSSKIPLDESTAYNTFKQSCFMGTDENEQIILAFSFDEPLKAGNYWFKFSLFNNANNSSEDIYIKFKIS